MNHLPDHLIQKLHGGASPVAVWRRHLGLTQAELASRAGMPPSELKRVEETKRMRGDQPERLAAALGIHPDCLLRAQGSFRGCEEALLAADESERERDGELERSATAV